LIALLDEARKRPPLTAEEREEQVRSFATGNIGIENPRVTRAVINAVADRR
jgi:hypothetical protein